MTEPELLHRFVDNELTVDERLQFLVRLGRDEALREQLIELEQLAAAARRLARPQLPADFVSRVLDRTAVPADQSAGLQAGKRNGLWTPRTLTWSLGGLAVAASLLLLVGTVTVMMLREPRALSVATAGAPGGDSPVLVRLVVLRPGAASIQIAGDFNGWNPARTSLTQVATGTWSVTIPLPPGRYEYQLVVDGHEWIADPFAAEQNDDGFGSRNAILDVPPSPIEAPRGAVL